MFYIDFSWSSSNSVKPLHSLSYQPQTHRTHSSLLCADLFPKTVNGRLVIPTAENGGTRHKCVHTGS